MNTLFENNDFILKSTGHDYDFVGIIETKTEEPLTFFFSEQLCDCIDEVDDWEGDVDESKTELLDVYEGLKAYDYDGEDTTFEDRTASFFGGMFNDLFKTWGSGNLPEPPKEITIESRKRTIIARAKQGKQAWHYYKGKEVRVRKAYTNGSSDPENWTYCVNWYADGQLVECENGVRLEQAAKALSDLPRWAEAYKAA